MTNSPPANVKLAPGEAGRVLCSNFDTLYVSFDVGWQNDWLFNFLSEMKDRAIGENKAQPWEWPDPEGVVPWACDMQPHAARGYAWLLSGHDFVLKLADAFESKSKPNVYAEMRSEALWTLTPPGLVAKIKRLLECAYGNVRASKVSRVDACVDLLLPEELWTRDLLDFMVGKAGDDATYRRRRKLSGFTIGADNLQARLYDKDLEIRTKSKKVWMYDLWGFSEVPEGHRVVRVEFQLRREALAALEIDSFEELLQKADGLWAYCTREWVKFQDDPGKHHTQQNTLPWWQLVQSGFLGAWEAQPLVRVKAIDTDERQLRQQFLGYATSLMALRKEKDTSQEGFQRLMEEQVAAAARDGLTAPFLAKRVTEKRARHERISDNASINSGPLGVDLPSEGSQSREGGQT